VYIYIEIKFGFNLEMHNFYKNWD